MKRHTPTVTRESVIVCRKHVAQKNIGSWRGEREDLLSYQKQDINEPLHDKTNKINCAQGEDSDKPGHPPSLVRVLAVRSMGS